MIENQQRQRAHRDGDLKKSDLGEKSIVYEREELNDFLKSCSNYN